MPTKSLSGRITSGVRTVNEWHLVAIKLLLGTGGERLRVTLCDEIGRSGFDGLDGRFIVNAFTLKEL